MAALPRLPPTPLRDALSSTQITSPTARVSLNYLVNLPLPWPPLHPTSSLRLRVPRRLLHYHLRPDHLRPAPPPHHRGRRRAGSPYPRRPYGGRLMAIRPRPSPCRRYRRLRRQAQSLP